MKNFLFLALFSMALFGCDRPNAHPETLDPIYADLVKRSDDLKKDIEANKKAVEEAEEEFKKVKPQTGQNLYAKKRLLEAEEKLQRVVQLQRYYEIKSESRMQSDQTEYLRAYSHKEPWPDPKEYQQFLEIERIQSKKLNWDIHERMAAAGVSPRDQKKPDEKKNAEKEAGHE